MNEPLRNGRVNPDRLGSMPARFEQYGLCLLFHMMLPFLPLGIELASQERVAPKSVLLFLAIYPIGIGVSSHSQLMFGATVIVGIMYSAFFGLTSGGVVVTEWIYTVGYLSLGAIVLVHAGERYKRHVRAGETFWKFN